MVSRALQVGNVTILELTDAAGPFAVPLSQLLPGVSAAQWAPYRERHPETFAGEDISHTHFGSYLLRSDGRTLLVDTGIGPDPSPALFPGMQGRLLTDLAASGVRPEEIDLVVTTHAHIDHVGWNLTTEGKPTFPNARYLLHQADWEALPALEGPYVPPYVDKTIRPLHALGVLDLLQGETVLTDAVTALPTPGHTPGHLSLLIASGGEKALIMGDAVVHPAMVAEPDWVFAFDSDPQQAIATRKHLLDRIEAEGMTMLQCHMPSPGYGRIVRLEGRRYWQAL
jgi:glyoxylase-like metal-dependent hydrolase (beta-lactamase superfamily II)